jgi:hypothetical protein
MKIERSVLAPFCNLELSLLVKMPDSAIEATDLEPRQQAAGVAFGFQIQPRVEVNRYSRGWAHRNAPRRVVPEAVAEDATRDAAVAEKAFLWVLPTAVPRVPNSQRSPVLDFAPVHGFRRALTKHIRFIHQGAPCASQLNRLLWTADGAGVAEGNESEPLHQVLP